MWVQSHAPGALSGVVGNPDALTEVRLWGQAWRQGALQKPLLLVGPPGVGKTLTAYALANEMGWGLVEFNASGTRNKETVEKVIKAAAVNASFSGNLRLVLLDEIDGIHGSDDKGGLSAILDVLKEARNPVIVTANDIYGDKRLASIRSFCRMVQYRKIPYPTISKHLREISEKEKLDYDVVSLNELAKNSSGDMRAALLDLESISSGTKKVTLEDVQQSGYRERGENIFNVMRTLFVSPSLSEIRRARSTVEVDPDLLKKWVDENIPRQFPMTESLAIAYDALSRGDIFDGRIFRRQHYGFLKYSGDLVASVGLRTNERAHGFISYQFPAILKRLSVMKGSSKKELIKKIQTRMHGSRSRIAQEVFYWSIILENDPNPEEWVRTFEFDEDELGYLLGTSPSSAKVRKMMERSLKEKEEKEEKAKGANSRSRKKETIAVEPEKVMVNDAPTPDLDDSESKKQTSLGSFFR